MPMVQRTARGANRCPFTIYSSPSHSARLVLSPDGRYLLADQLYLLDTPALVAAACRLVTRNLTRSEWQRELGDAPYARTCAALPEPAADALDWEQ